ncbi:MAG TPA: hypothetical protein VGF60_17625 [Xanthobacteraceae bacterium]|jgi:hypothetical protein
MSGVTRPMPVPEASRVRRSWRRLRFIPLAIAVLAMAAGLWTGLGRIGIPLPGEAPALMDAHGALMISGFLGTAISLERAVALGRGWAYGAPFLSGAGALALLLGAPRFAALAFMLSGAVLLAASASIAMRHLALFTIMLAVAAACWSAGSLGWLLGHPTPAVVGWWLDFLILTIAAERLELGRLASLSTSSQVAFAAAAVLLLIGSARSELAAAWAPFTAAGLLGCAVWLLRYDLARRTVRLAGQPRFAALSILLGHLWLGTAGILLVITPPGATAFAYDAAVHAITVGFVLSMIFGHAPIILPALTGMRVRINAFAYAPLGLLHVSMLVRLGGDMAERSDLRAMGAILTVLALVGYIVTLAVTSGAAAARRPG